MHYFTLNMEVARPPLRQPYGLPPISSDSSEDVSAVSTDTSPAEPAAAASAEATRPCDWSLPPAATDRPASAPDLPTAAAGGSPRHGAEARSISSPELSPLRTKSSPFQSPQGLSWAAKLAADAENLAASINVASALHDAPLPAAVEVPQAQQAQGQQVQAHAQQQALLPQLAPAMRRSCSSAKRRTFGTSAPGTPRLTTHTSMALRALPNPLEQVLSEELANPDMPVLFLHGVGGLPAYLEMLLQVGARFGCGAHALSTPWPQCA
jgi:hypothetical protein